MRWVIRAQDTDTVTDASYDMDAKTSASLHDDRLSVTAVS